MGRPMLPSNLKILKGTDQKCRMNENEPKPEIEAPDAPEFLNAVALAEWNRLVPELVKLGILAKIDSTTLAAYCATFARWVEAEGMLMSEGSVIETSNGNIIQSPWVGIANTALGHMRKFLTEFGMSPASRSKVIATGAANVGRPEKQNPFEALKKA